jgi:hypothetical protein
MAISPEEAQVFALKGSRLRKFQLSRGTGDMPHIR